MRRERRRFSVIDVAEAQSTRLRRRQRWYFALMGTCLALIVLAWDVVLLWSNDSGCRHVRHRRGSSPSGRADRQLEGGPLADTGLRAPPAECPIPPRSRRWSGDWLGVESGTPSDPTTTSTCTQSLAKGSTDSSDDLCTAIANVIC